MEINKTSLSMTLFLILLIGLAYAESDPYSKLNHQRQQLSKTYKPEWSDLDTRPLPEWYDKAKIGIFIHWGVFSVPSYASEWFWNQWKRKEPTQEVVKYMADHYPPGFSYQDFGPMFTAEFFHPDQWAKLFKEAGAKYVVLTTKHHEGFTLFPSKRSFSWNAMDVGPHRDLVADISKAVRNVGLKFGAYHSLYEWYNPLYLHDKGNQFKTQIYRDQKLWPDLRQLINDYQPSVLWADGDWETTDKYWNSTELLAWLYNDSPVKDEIVVNDRWGIGTSCKHGDFYNCKDNYTPGVLQKHKWESAFTIDKESWGFRRDININDILTINELLLKVVSTVSCGGNALINVGPTKEGTIAPIFQERLLTLGKWLDTNGEAIYETSPWLHQNDSYNSDVWYTCKKKSYDHDHPVAPPNEVDIVDAVYAIFLKWPEDDQLKIKDIISFMDSDHPNISILGHNNEERIPLKRMLDNDGVFVLRLPPQTDIDSRNAWVVKFESSRSD